MIQENEWHNGNLLIGDCLEKIKEIPSESVDCCISSPPYWGLRDYGTGEWKGGNNPECDHSAIRRKTRKERGGLSELQAGNEGGFGDESKWTDDICPDCGAKYEDPQWGSELHFEDYLDKMTMLMVEIKRILKPTGSCWINLGDSYSTQSGGMRDLAEGKTQQYGKINYTASQGAYAVRQPKMDLKSKTRIGIPERFMIRCIDDGWLLRNHIPWIKANAMPTSVKDRFQNRWESIFFFVKKGKYFFDLDAVREKPISDYNKVTKKNITTKLKQEGLFGDVQEKEPYGNQQPEGRSHFGTSSDIKKNMERKWEKDMGQSTQTIAARHSGNFDKDTGELLGNPRGKNPGDIFEESKLKQDNTLGSDGKPLATYKGFNERYRKQADVPGQSTQGIHRNRLVGKEDWDYSKKYKTTDNTPPANNSIKVRMAASRAGGSNHDGCLNDPRGKNPGDVIITSDRPYAVVEREGTVYYRDLPTHDEIREYLQSWRKITIESLEMEFNNSTPHHWFEKDGSYPTREDWIKIKEIFEFDDKYDHRMTTLYAKSAEKVNDPRGKNPGDIFYINPKPFIEAHFATFPEELPHKIIRCAVPEQVCKKCGVPVEDIMKPTEEYNKYLGQSWHDHEKDNEQGMQQKMEKFSVTAEYEKVGTTHCKCDAGFEPGVVFDPFMGAGTVALVALKLHRRWLGIELNPEYVDIIRKRLLPMENVSMDSFV